MDKKVIMCISTDWHLERSNLEQVKDLVDQQCKIALQNNLEEIYCLGDIFDSRKGQELSVLNTFSEILDIIEGYELTLICIAGNHDRVSYESEISYIKPYARHSALDYIPVYKKIINGEYNIYLLSFFKEDVWIQYYQEMLEKYPLDKTKKNILLTHTAFSNSINNDGTKVESKINYQLLKDFDLVLSGHYHNEQQVFKNTYHIPSICQRNYGENENKGFTLVYDDLSMELVQSQFKAYIKQQVDLSKFTIQQIELLANELVSSGDNIRLEVIGSVELLQSFDDTSLKRLGIDVKKKNPEIEVSIDYIEGGGEVEELNNNRIVELFQRFCDQENLDYEKGLTYLNRVL